MKWILCVVLLLFHVHGFAAAQYSKEQCDDFKQQKEQIRKRMNAGYGVQEGNWLNKRDRELFQLIGSHCSNPVAHKSSEKSVVIRSAQVTSAPSHQSVSLQNMPGWSANNATFKGDKAAAWSDYYQVPAKCRQRNLSELDFVQCAEHKAAVRKEFEHSWDNLKFTPLTVGTAQASLSQQRDIANTEVMEMVTLVHVDTLKIPPVQSIPSVDKNFHKHFTWFGISFVFFVAGACWLIWRK